MLEEFVKGIVPQAQQPVGREQQQPAFALYGDLSEEHGAIVAPTGLAVEGIVGRERQGYVGKRDHAGGPGLVEWLARHYG